MAFPLVRVGVIFLLLLVLLPYVLTPLYLLVQPVSTLMLWRSIKGARVERSYLPIGQMAPSLPLAVSVAEDARFCTHHGIDWDSLREAVADAEDTGDVPWRLDHHPTDGKEPVSLAGTQLHP